MLLGTVAVSPQECQVKAASVKKTKKAALKAYKKLLSKDEIYIGKEYVCKLSEDNQFAIEDLNHDGIPEMIIDAENEFGMSCMDIVFTYYKSNVCIVIKTSHGYVSGYKKGNIFSADYMNRGYAVVMHYSIVKGKAKGVAECCDDTATGNADCKGTTYLVNDKESTKKKYDSVIKKHTKGSKMYKIKKYKVTSGNIKKYLK